MIFLRKMRAPMLFGFSTSSSSATLPVTLETVEQRIGVRNEVASLWCSGATINMNGTAIMQGVATVFIAQYFNITLEAHRLRDGDCHGHHGGDRHRWGAGVGLIMLTMVLQQVGLPVEGIMLIIGVDRLLDMARTIVNVAGDAMVATIVARSENKLDLERYADMNAGAELNN